jgi:hypothetical protein
VECAREDPGKGLFLPLLLPLLLHQSSTQTLQEWRQTVAGVGTWLEIGDEKNRKKIDSNLPFQLLDLFCDQQYSSTELVKLVQVANRGISPRTPNRGYLPHSCRGIHPIPAGEYTPFLQGNTSHSCNRYTHSCNRYAAILQGNTSHSCNRYTHSCRGIQAIPATDTHIPAGEYTAILQQIHPNPEGNTPQSCRGIHPNPAMDIPVMDIPVMDIPVMDIPVMDIPVMDIPVMDIPARDIPVMDIPARDIPGIPGRID